MAWLPILFVCLMGSCDFMVGDAEWSTNDCQEVIETATKELEQSGAVVAGVCIQVRVT
jgi:hypothetical protein